MIDEDYETETFAIENARGVGETGKAVLVMAAFFEEGQLWIPKSQIHDMSEVYAKGTDGTLIVNEWFAKKSGWL